MPQKTPQRYSFLSGREKQTQEKTPLPTEKDKNHSKTPLSQTPPFNTPPSPMAFISLHFEKFLHFLILSFLHFSFHSHYPPPSTAPKSTSSTSASRHRRHRLTDVDDVDLEGVEQRGKRMCRYRNDANGGSIRVLWVFVLIANMIASPTMARFASQ